MPFIVTGCWRTGTSATMAALDAGGLDVYADADRDVWLNRRAGDDTYIPNEAYREPGPRDFSDPTFPREHGGKLIKVLFGGLPRLAPMEADGYRYVFMRRDSEEIRQSWQALNQRRIVGFRLSPFLRSEDAYRAQMDMACDLVRNRRDTLSLHEFRYREDLIADPERVFSTLARDGWPIDPYAAAAVIDPAQCRFRLEELTVGI